MKKILSPSLLFLLIPFCTLWAQKEKSSITDDKMHIAVIDFDAKDIPREEAVKLTEIMRNDMVNTGKFIIIERAQMGQILKEQGLQATGATDVSNAAQIGKILSANKILVGTIMKIENEIVITGRIVDVEKGVVDFSEKVTAANSKEVLNAVSLSVSKLSNRIVRSGAAVSTDNVAMNDFDRFLDLTSKDDLEKATALFGNPSGKGTRWLSYFDGQMEIAEAASGGISVIRIKSPEVLIQLKKRGIDDPRLKFYGMDFIQLKQILGEPSEFVLGMATYNGSLPDGRPLRLMFVLDENKKLSRMTVVQMVVVWEKPAQKN